MFLATDSQKTYMTTTMTMPTVFSTKSDPVQPLETVNPRFADSGSSSETDTDEDDESEDNEDTIVRWGWVWYKGEMRRVGEIPEMDRCNLEHNKNLPPSECDDALSDVANDAHPTSRYKTRITAHPRSRENTRSHPSSALSKEFPSPRPSPVYVEATPYRHKARKSTSYHTLYRFDDEDGDAESDSESDDDFDCEQVADFLVRFLEDDEDDDFYEE